MTSPSQELTHPVCFLCSRCHFDVSCTHKVYELYTLPSCKQVSHFRANSLLILKLNATCMNVSKATTLQCKDFICVSSYIMYIWQAFSYFIKKKFYPVFLSETFFILHLTKAQPEGTESVNIDPRYIYFHKIFQWQKKNTELNYEPASYRTINRHFDECIAERKWDAFGERA